MDFIENLVHEPLYVLSHLKLVSGHSISRDLILLWSSYLIPIFFSHPSILRQRQASFVHLPKLSLLKLHLIRQRKNLGKDD